MYINEILENTKVVVQISKDFRVIEIPSKVSKVFLDGVLLECLMLKGQPLNIDFSKVITTIVVEQSPLPIKFRFVNIAMVKYGDEIFHVVKTKKEGVEVNRRNNYRVFIGEEGEAYFNDSQKSEEVVVRDVSMGGFAFIMNQDKDIEHQKVKLFYKDGKGSVTLQGIVVRKLNLEAGKVLYGCKLIKEPNGLSNYLSKKQIKKMQNK